MPWLAEDQQRLVLFRSGDRATLSAVFRTYAPGLAGRLMRGMLVRTDGTVLLRGGATPSDIDDVVQEVFIRAFAPSTRRAYDGVRPFSDFLVGIARNILADWHRTDARRARLFGSRPEQSVETSPGEAIADEALEAKQLGILYREFATSLDDADRVLLELRIGGDAPRREVSERTGYSAMRVRIRERALRKQLFERLKAAGYAEVD